MKERARSGEEASKGSETLPLRQRAERNEGARQRRTLLPHGRTKRRGASWESEPCTAADAMLDEHTMERMRKSNRKKRQAVMTSNSTNNTELLQKVQLPL